MAACLSEGKLKRISGAYDLETVKRIDLSGHGLTSIDGIQLCSNLVELLASDNSIDDLAPLGKLSSLRKVDVSRNSVSSLDGILDLCNL